MKILSRGSLSEALRYELGFTKQEARDAVDFIFSTMSQALKDGDDVCINGFCSMKVVDRPSRKCLNQITGRMMTIAPGKRIRVRMSEALIQEIDPGFKMKVEDEDELLEDV